MIWVNWLRRAEGSRVFSLRHAFQKLPSALLPFAVGKRVLCRRLFDALPSANLNSLKYKKRKRRQGLKKWHSSQMMKWLESSGKLTRVKVFRKRKGECAIDTPSFVCICKHDYSSSAFSFALTSSLSALSFSILRLSSSMRALPCLDLLLRVRKPRLFS